ncbi:hypothetical protein NC652_017454 [Populus alba x Populus x berolinensis]|nr:hypothetical protein NC652_017454 [Populus alba x Populus x berolinensis]
MEKKLSVRASALCYFEFLASKNPSNPRICHPPFLCPASILYKSLIGPDGWCIHYEKSTRKCSIYPDRPYFCRVEPDIFESLYGITKKKFNKEACGIGAVVLCHKEKGLKRDESGSLVYVHSTVLSYDSTSVFDAGKIIKQKA